MSNKVFIDTQFVVALVNRRDQHHQEAVKLADDYAGHPVLITDAVLLEIGNALACNFRQQAVDVIEDFFASDEVEIVRLSAKLLEEAFTLYKTHQDKEWSLVDCVSFVVMKEAGTTLALTFDQHFVQAGFRALMRETPDV